MQQQFLVQKSQFGEQKTEIIAAKHIVVERSSGLNGKYFFSSNFQLA